MWLQVFAFNRCFVLLDDAIAGAKPEPGTLSKRFGRIKGIENSRRFGDSWPGIGNFYDYSITVGPSPQDNFTTADFLDRINSVVQHVQENLQQMVVVAYHGWKISVEIAD